MGTGEVPVAPQVPGAGGEERPSPDRRRIHHDRRKARRLRLLYALGGIAVLVAFLVATVVVVDMVR